LLLYYPFPLATKLNMLQTYNFSMLMVFSSFIIKKTTDDLALHYIKTQTKISK